MASPNPQPQTKFTPQNVLNNVYNDLIKALAVSGVGWDGTQAKVINSDTLTTLIEYDGNSNPIFIGQAAPGTLPAAASWQIRKLTFDGNGNVTQIKYASYTMTFDQVWDDRVSLTYA